jgi:hypothetical protein
VIRPPHPFTPFAADDIERSIPERFDQQVRVHRGRVAIQSDRESMSFADLDRMATSVAHRVLSP